jgi:hypothetical protein
MSFRKKLYAYVDESGQDTQGQIFVVSVAVLDSEQRSLAQDLERIEKETGKGNAKWHKSRHEFRSAYIERLVALAGLRQSVFVEVFKDGKEYLKLTTLAAAKAILRKAGGDGYRATVFVDGLKGAELPQFSRGLRELHIHTRKVRGVRKDENDAFIRLADAVCGLVRDAEEAVPWAVSALSQLREAGVVTRL